MRRSGLPATITACASTTSAANDEQTHVTTQAASTARGRVRGPCATCACQGAPYGGNTGGGAW